MMILEADRLCISFGGVRAVDGEVHAVAQPAHAERRLARHGAADDDLVDATELLTELLEDPEHGVVVGDVDQLPSVGPGQVLADIITSGAVPVVQPLLDPMVPPLSTHRSAPSWSTATRRPNRACTKA